MKEVDTKPTYYVIPLIEHSGEKNLQGSDQSSGWQGLGTGQGIPCPQARENFPSEGNMLYFDFEDSYMTTCFSKLIAL